MLKTKPKTVRKKVSRPKTSFPAARRKVSHVKRNPPADRPVVVDATEMAFLFLVTRKTVAEWANEGRIVRLGHGRYDLKESIRRWMLWKKPVTQEDLDQIQREIEWSELVKHLTPKQLEKLMWDEMTPEERAQERAYRRELRRAG